MFATRLEPGSPGTGRAVSPAESSADTKSVCLQYREPIVAGTGDFAAAAVDCTVPVDAMFVESVTRVNTDGDVVDAAPWCA